MSARKTSRTPRPPLVIAGTTIAAGQRATVEVPVPKLYTHTEMNMPVHVVHGRHDGPRLFVSAAIHGDELNGVEIVRRLLLLPALRKLRGSLLAVPIVNVHGFIQRRRVLPDGRDLNRVFPGSEEGSLAARLAGVFMGTVVEDCDYGIDLHTGANHRTNLPQVRASVDDEETLKLARAFGAPVILNANLRDGSLRQAVADLGIPILLYETGEALRFHETGIRAGVRGIVGVMQVIGMLPPPRKLRRAIDPVVARTSSWLRAPASGILRTAVRLGAHTKRGTALGFINDPFGETEYEMRAHVSGVLIGRTNLPLVHEGEAVFHIARLSDGKEVEQLVESFHAEQEAIPLDPDLAPIVPQG